MIKRQDIHLVLEQGKPVGPQIYTFLRDQIIHGDLLPGTGISESEISRNLSVSRQPVREAFIKLRDEGLVEVRPQRGTFVTKISLDAVGDARFVREAIEADIVRVLVENSTPELVAKLRDLVQLQKDLSRAKLDNSVMLDKFMELDERFHRCLADFAGKPTAWKVIANMKAHFDRVRYLSSTQKPMQRLIDQHEEVVEAIAMKDAVKAEKAIRSHLREVLLDLPKVVSLKPDMFEGHEQS